MKYNEWKGMNKTAAGAGISPAGAAGAAGDVLSNGAVLLIASLAGIGGVTGWAGAKLNAHDKQDVDTIQKEYENERLKADLGYLSSKTKYEYDQYKNKQAPKPARVFA